MLEGRSAMEVTIRPFEEQDIPLKIEWINNPLNHKYLHYDLPLELEKTINWFRKNKDRTDRFDATIEVDGNPVGLIGLLGIDKKNSKAEYYITIGDRDYLGKGVAYQSSKLLLQYAFKQLNLNKVYLYTEVENRGAQRLFEKVGFSKEGLVKDDLFFNGKFVSRYMYGVYKNNFLKEGDTPIYFLENEMNNIYIKRDDLYPFSFGGNKARKGMLFWKDLKEKKADYIVTYGSTSSNHCRVIANIAASENIPCCIISPKEIAHETFNKKMMELFNAEIIFSEVSKVHETIENVMSKLENLGYNPYFIQGGGHGNLGTQAYVDCYEEIKRYELDKHIHFDYIFFASGTGTTQAGLICGKLLNNDDKKIVGISIARKNPRGGNVVKDSVEEYLGHKVCDEEIIFDDSFTQEGYGIANVEIQNTINEVMKKYGIPLDSTYTAKAFYGMKEYIQKNKIESKNILFIHTGGTPLFFDNIEF